MLRSALALILVSLSVAAAAGSAPLQQGPAAAQPGGATFVVSGRGWGHGVGMSQWGAHGFAKRGAAYDEILAHYYPGTQLGPAPVAKVRVLLAEGAKTLAVEADAPFQVKDGAGVVHPLEPGSYAFGPGFRLTLAMGGEPQQLPGPLLFTRGVLPLELKGRSYRGSFEVSAANGRLRLVNVVALEAYLYGVVPDEMPDDWPIEALKAQAVVARSYALANRRGGDFDLYADVRSQVYGGLGAESFTATAAVDETAAQVLTFNAKVVSTPYHSTSGGRTANVTDVWAGRPVPYLVAVADPYDNASPHHRWGPFAYDGATLAQKLGLPSVPLDLAVKRNPSRRVDTVTATFADGTTQVLPAQSLRAALGLRSTWFDLGVLSLGKPSAPVLFGTKGSLPVVVRGIAVASLEQKVDGAWKAIGTLKPAASALNVAIKPLVTSEYRLRAGTAATPSVRVLVAPFVRFHPAPTPLGLGGVVKPLLPGAIVVIQRQDEATGAWSEAARSPVDAKGEFEAVFRLEPATYRARVAPGRGFAVGVSPVLKVVPA